MEYSDPFDLSLGLGHNEMGTSVPLPPIWWVDQPVSGDGAFNTEAGGRTQWSDAPQEDQVESDHLEQRGRGGGGGVGLDLSDLDVYVTGIHSPFLAVTPSSLDVVNPSAPQKKPKLVQARLEGFGFSTSEKEQQPEASVPFVIGHLPIHVSHEDNTALQTMAASLQLGIPVPYTKYTDMEGIDDTLIIPPNMPKHMFDTMIENLSPAEKRLAKRARSKAAKRYGALVSTHRVKKRTTSLEKVLKKTVDKLEKDRLLILDTIKIFDAHPILKGHGAYIKLVTEFDASDKLAKDARAALYPVDTPRRTNRTTKPLPHVKTKPRGFD
jgi:hypothetical protein